MCLRVIPFEEYLSTNFGQSLLEDFSYRALIPWLPYMMNTKRNAYAGSHKSTDQWILVRAPSLTVIIFDSQILPYLISWEPLNLFMLYSFGTLQLTLVTFLLSGIKHFSKELWFILGKKPLTDSYKSPLLLNVRLLLVSFRGLVS